MHQVYRILSPEHSKLIKPKIDYLIENIEPNGEVFADVISKQYQVKFEEVKNMCAANLLE
jgi:hypothetical protein